jgi:hypothetical protein
MLESFWGLPPMVTDTCGKAQSSEGQLGVDLFAEAGFKSLPR